MEYAKLARMRTIKAAVAWIKEQDSSSAISEWYVRKLVKEGKIKVFHAGRKQLISLDLLLQYLAGELDEETPVIHNYGKLRQVNE